MSTNRFPSWDKISAKEEATGGRYKARILRQKVYKNNCEIFSAGGYISDKGNEVEIPINDPMLDGTKVYRDAFDVNNIAPLCADTKTNVINDDCLAVAKSLLDEGLNPCVMNLADAYVACGFYKKGSSAQEESLCRATTLSRSLFQFFKAKSGKPNRYAEDVNVAIKEYAYPMDLNYGGIYSPNVTVFRNGLDHHALLEETYKVGIVSVAALDFNEKHGKNLEYQAPDGGMTAEGEEILKNKIRTIYRITLSNGHDALVAGAFGCGAFRLPADKVATLFHEILDEKEFKNKFRNVTFAILDKDGANGKFAPFYKTFN
ncbi:MAG: TIGR02452 family protein [Alistipes sp.]|nr:TIGR02452 family protein [Alistipes sp.]